MDFKYLALILLVCVIATFGQRHDFGDCPEGSPRLRCLVNPCSVMRCRGYPQAECRNDNPCEPNCEGHFYDGDRQLSRRECRRGNGRRRLRNRNN